MNGDCCNSEKNSSKYNLGCIHAHIISDVS